ncbi:MAG: helix-turn-helix domain-containing protein [Gammaproteobacteria bacterium]|nr:helix-turn-helix domain-containing protein [Gammaproteobacteria bacterium]
MNLGLWVKQARNSANLSQEQLAHELGCTKGNVSAWENNRHAPSVAQVDLIARLTNFPYVPHREVASADFNGLPLVTSATSADGNSANVKHFNVTASMGSGAVVEDHPQVVQSITVSLAELKKQASFSNPPNLSFITGRGDSMLPTFNDGDMLLVDQNVTEHKIDAVFAFTYDGEFYVKTLQRVPGRGVMAVSHNRTVYEPFRIDPEKPFTIHGRVVLAWNARKL